MDRTVESSDDLVKEAMERTGATSEREAVERVLKDYLKEHGNLKKPKDLLDLVGKIKIRDNYDYKAMRAGDGDPD